MAESTKVNDDYHAYDATSRSQPLPPLPPSFTLPANNIVREDITVPDFRIFLLHNLLSDEECDFLVRSTEEIGYDAHSDVKAEYPPDYRSNQRLIIINQPFADAIWRRVQPLLQYKDITHIAPLGWATEGLWLPKHVNEGFLFSRYKSGNFFMPHYDGMYKNEYEECSIYTLTLYLNDDYKGGRVLFLKSKDGKGEENVTYTFTPRKGTALIFNHDTLHAGEEVQEGTKYIVRTGIMFKHVEDLSDPNRGFESDPEWIHMRDVFATFTELGKEGNPEKFTKTFLEVQRIQLAHGRSLRNVELAGLPDDVMFHLFTFLEVKETLKAALISHAWHAFARNGRIWKKLFSFLYGVESAKLLQPENVDSSIVDFYSFYRKRYLTEQTKAPIIVYLSDHAYGCRSENGVTKYSKSIPARVQMTFSPWDSSYHTYISGYGKLWFVETQGIHGPTFRELVSHVKGSLRPITKGAHPYVFVTETNTFGWEKGWPEWNKERTQKNFSGYQKVPRKIARVGPGVDDLVYMLYRHYDIEAVAFIDAGLCSLYAQGMASGISIVSEIQLTLAPITIDIAAWHNYELTESHTVLRDGAATDPDTFSDKVAQKVLDLQSKHNMPSTVTFVRKSEGGSSDFPQYASAIQHRLSKLKIKVIQCSEIEVMKGATIFSALPQFYDNLYYKSALFEQARGASIASSAK